MTPAGMEAQEKRALVEELRDQATLLRSEQLAAALERDRCAGALVLGYRGATMDKARDLVVEGFGLLNGEGRSR